MIDRPPWKYFADALESVERTRSGPAYTRGGAVSEASRATLHWLLEEEGHPAMAARILVARFVERSILWSLLDESVGSLALDLEAIWSEEEAVRAGAGSGAVWRGEWRVEARCRG